MEKAIIWLAILLVGIPMIFAFVSDERSKQRQFELEKVKVERSCECQK